MVQLLRRLLRELKRRKVVQATLAYVAVALLVTQTADVLADALVLPDWVMRLVVLLLLLGLPLAITLSWIYDLTLPSLVRDATGARGQLHEGLYAVLTLRMPQLAGQAWENPVDLLRWRQQLQIELEPVLQQHGAALTHWQPARLVVAFVNPVQAAEAGLAIRKCPCFTVNSTVNSAMTSVAPNTIANTSAGQPAAAIAIGNALSVDSELVGEGVALSADIAAIAEPGELLLSEQVHDSLRHHPALRSLPHLVRELPSLGHPVRMYRLHEAAATAPELPPASAPTKPRWRRHLAWSLPAALLVTGASSYFWLHRQQDIAPPTVAPRTFAIVLQARDHNGEPLPALATSVADLANRLVADITSQAQLYPALEGHAMEQADFQVTGILQQQGDGLVLKFALRDSKGALIAEPTVNGQTTEIASLYNGAQEALLAALLVATGGKRLGMYTGMQSVSWEAYQHYAQGQQLLREPARDALRLAVAEFDASLRIAPDFVLALAGRCKAWLDSYLNQSEANALHRADADCERALQLEPQSYEANRMQAELLRTRGENGAARQVYQQLLLLNPLDVTAYHGLAGIEEAEGKLIDAEQTLMRAVNMRPEWWLPQRTMAQFLFRQSRYDDAAQAYRKVLQLAAPHADGYSNLGGALYMAGKLEDAADAFHRAFQLQPSFALLNNLATLHYSLGRFDEAIEEYEKAIELAPDDYRVYGNLADAQRHAGVAAGMWQVQYHRALSGSLARLEQMEDPEAHASAAYYSGQLDDFALAEKYIQRALTLAPTDAVTHFRLALIRLRQNDSEQAIAAVREALRLGYPAKLLVSDPDFRPLVADPRFLAVLKLAEQR